MKKICVTIIFVAICAFASAQKKEQSDKNYFPPYGNWQHQTPLQAGLNPEAILHAVAAAKQNEIKAPRNGEMAQYQSFGKEPFSAAIGPLKDRGEPTGLIIYKGYIIAQWGEPDRVDITHSVTKSFLSTIIGLAVDKGMINSTADTVAKYMSPVQLFNNNSATPAQPDFIYPFETEHNRKLTWEVMLRQTSDWEGTLWGKPDWADRPQGDIEQYRQRKRNAPGTVYKYNDVRVNALALAALNVWRKPLPQVLKENIMDPIGASNTWRWTGYNNSWVVLDGQPVQSVSGGGHWGGGMFINAYDMARFGLLTLHHGNWNGKQLISKQWVKQALTPGPANDGYGYMNWFLNTRKKMLPSAPANIWMHIGNGGNMIYCDTDHDLVIVTRWIETKAMDEVVKDVLASLPPKS